jgi:hypothetical protein
MRQSALLALFTLLTILAQPVSADDADVAMKIWNNRQAVVKIIVEGKLADGRNASPEYGTGFLVSRFGYILTADHVIGQDLKWHEVPGGVERTIRVLGVSNTDGRVELASRAKIVNRDAPADVAILRINGDQHPSIPIASEPTAVLARAYVIGYRPLMEFPDAKDGSVASTDFNTAVAPISDFFSLNLDLTNGHSGSPVFNSKGEVVGFVHGASEDNQGKISLAVPISRARIALSVVPDVAFSGQEDLRGLVSAWAGDNSAADAEGNRIGRLHGNVAYESGLSGGKKAFGFHASSDYLSAPTSDLPASDDDRTVELWVRLTAVPPAETEQARLFYYGELSHRRAYIIGYSGEFGIFFSNYGNSISSGTPLETGRWHHIAVTNVGSDSRLYLDGEIIGRARFGIDTARSEDLYVGGGALSGRIADVRIFSRALRPAEIKATFENVKSRNPELFR